MASLALKVFFLNCVDCFALLDKEAEKSQPTDEDLESIEANIRGWVEACPEVKSFKEITKKFLDLAYSEGGQEHGLSPQMPREEVDVVLELVQEVHPEEWAAVAQYFHLQPN